MAHQNKRSKNCKDLIASDQLDLSLSNRRSSLSNIFNERTQECVLDVSPVEQVFGNDWVLVIATL